MFSPSNLKNCCLRVIIKHLVSYVKYATKNRPCIVYFFILSQHC